jgi:hypothetical protein
MRRVDHLHDLPGGDDVARQLGPDPVVDGAVSWQDKGILRIRVWGSACRWTSRNAALAGLPASAVVWEKGVKRAQKGAPEGRTQAALRLLERDPNLTPFAAAKQAGVHVSAVYRALQRASRPVCECCGQRLPA